MNHIVRHSLLLEKTELNVSACTTGLISLGNPQRVVSAGSFFKTGPGMYAHGDIFLGISVPTVRKEAHRFFELPLSQISFLLKNKYHEVRLCGLLILVAQFKKATKEDRTLIVRFYLEHLHCVNNWDLVDSSAYQILGAYLAGVNNDLLIKLARSTSLWERRVAIVASFAFVRAGRADCTFSLVEILMNDSEDLIHKACGWMLREVGKKVSEKELLDFLVKHKQGMPRTMLRYAIERLPMEQKRILMAR